MLLALGLAAGGCVSDEDEGWISGYGDSSREERAGGGREDPTFGPRVTGRRR